MERDGKMGTCAGEDQGQGETGNEDDRNRACPYLH
jgi:hypothetical protein